MVIIILLCIQKLEKLVSIMSEGISHLDIFIFLGVFNIDSFIKNRFLSRER